MKVVHVIETLAVEGGGGDRACIELAGHQAKLGHEVTVLCFGDHGETPLSDSEVVIFRLQRRDKADMRRLIQEVSKTSDVVHVHGAWRRLQVWARKACQRTKTPFVYQPHGLFSPTRMQHKRLRKLIWFFLFEAKTLSAASAVIVESARDRVSVARVARGAKLIELPCGGSLFGEPMGTSAFHKRYFELARKPYLLYFGRLDYHKGVDLLINAYAQLPEIHADCSLAIVGPDFNRTASQLHAQVKSLGLTTVFFYGKVTELSEKAALFDSAAAFVLPSYDENFGITVLEALSRGCPSLVSSATAWDQLENEGAGMVFEPNLAALKATLVRFMALAPSEREALSVNGRLVAKRYDWLELARRSIASYAEVGAVR